jgi:hypothetical protein
MQHSDLEFNLCWVFDQLTKLDTESDAASRKRTTSHSSDAGAGGAGGSGGGHGPSLNLSHLRRVFGFLGVQLSDDELEEVLNMLDDDMDGRVTQQDFMHALQGESADDACRERRVRKGVTRQGRGALGSSV